MRACPLVLVLGACALLAGCATQASPKASPSELRADEVRKEMEVGEAALARIAGERGVVRDEESTVYLTTFLRSLALFSSRQELTYHAAILDEDAPTAYSLPGGYVLVSKGLLRSVQSPGALAGVLAHELGHVDMRHVLENVTIQVSMSPLETLARFLAGSRQVITGAIDQVNDKIEERLFIEGFAASDEYAADAYALRLLQALGLSAEDYVSYLKSLEAREGEVELEALDRTHPPLARRVEALEASIERGLPPVRSDEGFQRLRERAATF